MTFLLPPGIKGLTSLYYIIKIRRTLINFGCNICYYTRFFAVLVSSSRKLYINSAECTNWDSIFYLRFLLKSAVKNATKVIFRWVQFVSTFQPIGICYSRESLWSIFSVTCLNSYNDLNEYCVERYCLIILWSKDSVFLLGQLDVELTVVISA